jgi:hypothetical protein
MGSILHYANKGVRHLDLGVKVGGFVLNSGIEAVSGFGIGYVRGRYRDKTIGRHAPVLAALIGKAAAVATTLLDRRSSAVGRIAAGAFDSVGGAGLALIGAEQGLKYGNKAAGVQAIVVQANAIPAGAKQVSMGALPPAPDGEALSWNQLMQLSEMR